MVEKQAWVLTKRQQKITEVIITLGRQKPRGKTEIVVIKQATGQNTDPNNNQQRYKGIRQKSRSVQQSGSQQANTDQKNRSVCSKEAIPRNDSKAWANILFYMSHMTTNTGVHC